MFVYCYINLKHATCKQHLKEKLGEEAVFISLTTNMWTSIATESYITVTAHYIDYSWVQQVFVLETLHFPERHTGINFAQKLKEVWRNMR